MPRPKTRNESLRSHMIDVSLATLERDGPTGVTARNIATLSGASTAALYELFGDKSGLIRNIFFEGFALLAERLEALPSTDDARADLIDSLDVSRQFALDSPMLFEVMYARPFTEFKPTSADDASAAIIYRHLVDRVAAWLETGRRSKTTVDAAHALVAANRGLIATELAGLLGTSSANTSRRRRLTIDALLDGLTERSNP